MKQLFTILLLFSAFVSLAQQPYLPSTDGQSTSRPLGASGFSTDARSTFHNRTGFSWDPYDSLPQVLSTLNTSLKRKGNFPIFVKTAGIVDEYWFRNCVADSCLVLKTSGTGSGSADTSIIRTSKYGALPAMADARVSIQAAIDAAGPFGGRVIIDKPGTYTMSAVTTGGIKRCLTMAANVTLYIPPGVILKLANSQVTNATPVQVIHIPATATNVYIGWPGAASTTAGRIDGNVANQPGYTLGFSQTNGNYLIGSANAVRGITIEGLHLTGVFSNTINIGGTNTYGNSFDVKISNVYQEVFGEGMQIISTDNVIVKDIMTVMDSAKVEGDGIELSHCRYFSVSDCRVITSTGRPILKGGAGIDCYASRHGTVSNFYIQGPQYGIQIETNFSDNTKWPDEISVSNGTMQGINFCPIWISGGRLEFSNIKSNNSVFCGAQMYNFSNTSAFFTFSNMTFNGVSNVLVGDGVNFTGRNLTIKTTAPDASPLSLNTCYVDIDGLIAEGGTANTVIVNGPTAFPVGRVVNVMADGMNAIVASGATALHASALIMEGIPPFTTTNGDVTVFTGINIAYPNGTITSGNIPNGTKGQKLRLKGGSSPWIQAGAKIKLNNADSINLSNVEDFLDLEFGADSIWRQTGRQTAGGSETDPLYSAAAPYLAFKYAVNVFDTVQKFSNSIFLRSQNLSTRPAIGAARIPGEINGSNYYDEGDQGGHLRLSAGGTTAKSFIDLSGTNGDVDFANNIIFGTAGTERMRLNSTDAYLSLPFHLTASVSLADSSDKAITSKWFKQNAAGFSGGGGGGPNGDVFLNNFNAFTQANSITTTNTNPLALSSTGAYGYLSIDNTTGAPNTGIWFKGNGNTKWSFSSYQNRFTIYNATLSKDAFSIDTTTNQATFWDIAKYNKNENGVKTDLGIPNYKYVDSSIAANQSDIYFDSTVFKGTGDISAPITLKWGTKLAHITSGSTYTIPDSIGYVLYAIGSTSTLTLPNPALYPNRVITIRNASSGTMTLSGYSIFYLVGATARSSLLTDQSITIIADPVTGGWVQVMANFIGS